MSLLSAASALIVIYGIYAIYTGRVYMNSSSLQPIYRKEEPKTFWFGAVFYIVMGIILYVFKCSNDL
jgi:hypothetical protein